MIRRLVVTGGTRIFEVALLGAVVVGRDPACDISEETDPLLSRRHAEFSTVGRDVVVRDLGSRNGILVNGSKTSQSVLRPGDVVQLGHLQIQLLEGAGLLLDTAAAEGAPPPAITLDDVTALIDRASANATVVMDATSNDVTAARDQGTLHQETTVSGVVRFAVPSFAGDDDDATIVRPKRAGS